MTPAVTYIVSCFERPLYLTCCLASLRLQTDTDHEVFIADNAIDPFVANWHRATADRFGAIYVNTRSHQSSPGWDSYWAAEWVVHNAARGEFVCMPSDDSYYVPCFQERMLTKARTENLELVYCNMLYGRPGENYRLLDVQAKVCHIDKTGYFLRRDRWVDYPAKSTVPGAGSCSDGEQIEELKRQGVRHGKVEEYLAVHN